MKSKINYEYIPGILRFLLQETPKNDLNPELAQFNNDVKSVY